MIAIKPIIRKLNKAIAQKSSDDVIKGYQEILAENISEAAKEATFFSLPFRNLISIIRRVDFTKEEQPVELIKTIVEGSSQAYRKETSYLLNIIKCSDLQMTIPDYVHILHKFSNCELCVKLGELYEYEESLLVRDWDYEISVRDTEIAELNKKLEEVKKEITLQNETLREPIYKSSPETQRTNPRKRRRMSIFHKVTEMPSDFEPDIIKAAEEGKLSSVQYLCEVENADCEVTNDDNNTALHLACRNGHILIVRYLCEKRNANKEAKGRWGFTPLHYATCHGHLPVVQYLCEKQNANIEARSESGRTPLHFACRDNHLQIVRYLIEDRHANGEAADNIGQTPSQVTYNQEIIDYLRSQGIEY